MRRAVLAGIVLIAGIALVPTAGAASTERIAGADRYATAAAVSAAHFSSTVPVAYIATGKGCADALAAVPAAAAADAPMLLVTPRDVPGATADELRKDGAQHVVIVRSCDST